MLPEESSGEVDDEDWGTDPGDRAQRRDNPLLRELTDFRDRLWGLLKRSADLDDCRPMGGRICSIIEEASFPPAPSVLAQRKPSAARAAREQRIWRAEDGV